MLIVAAAILPSSNLTNLVLTGAFDFSFISYAARSILPTLVTAVTIFPLLAFVLFKSREQVPKEIDVVDLQSPTSERRSALPSSRSNGDPGSLADKCGAIFGSVLLGVTLAVLVGTSPLKIPVWRVTVPPALIMLTKDIWHDRYLWRKEKPAEKQVELGAEGADASSREEQAVDALNSRDEMDGNSTSLGLPQTITPEIERSKKEPRTLQGLYTWLRKDKFPTVLSIIPCLPISLVLFAFCMFILVQGLSTWGWVDVFSHWWTSWIHTCEKVGTGFAVVGAVYSMLVISTFLCNVRVYSLSLYPSHIY